MPKVAEFEGIRIRLFPDEHPPPHFHAVYGEFVAQIRIRPTEVLRGSLPPAKVRVVLTWARLHETQLMQAWDYMAAGRKPRRIA